jgi:hypothetical protein
MKLSKAESGKLSATARLATNVASGLEGSISTTSLFMTPAPKASVYVLSLSSRTRPVDAAPSFLQEIPRL